MRSGNGNRSERMTRGERAAARRKRRARQHLERIRGRSPQPVRFDPRRLAAPIFAIALLVGFATAATALRPGPLHSIAVRGADHVPAEEIARATGLVAGTRLEGVDREAVARQLAGHAWIARARALALPGGRMLIEVEERRAAAVLEAPEAWAVDAEGVAFAPIVGTADPALPRIHSAIAPPRGETAPELAKALALVRAVEATGLPAPDEIFVSAPDDPEGYALRLPGLRGRVVLGSDAPEARLDALRRLLDAGVPELASAERIDLRFEDQAVLDGPPPQTGAAQAAATHGGA